MFTWPASQLKKHNEVPFSPSGIPAIGNCKMFYNPGIKTVKERLKYCIIQQSSCNLRRFLFKQMSSMLVLLFSPFARTVLLISPDQNQRSLNISALFFKNP